MSEVEKKTLQNMLHFTLRLYISKLFGPSLICNL